MVQHNQEDSQTGHTIFEEFTTVVTLKEQMHVTDPVWQDFLQHLRVSQVQECHIAMLRTLVLTNPKCVEMDFSSPPWNNASLVTPCHGVCQIWNNVALHKHGQEAQSIVLECQAEDTIKGQPLTLCERYAALLRQQGADSRQCKQDLPDVIHVTCGMKVMVMQNVETDLDTTNGACGTIVNIWLNPNELPISTVQPLIQLKYMPVCILVKLERTRAT
ncbi:hypothetical protein SCLCIDRAFT_103778 [Scleroderma citrinum Foug A]|uniref:DNA helicase n=1 Tax=Scleroderma citrinum Foug A TaxID=1036808 RepID=A0A0C3AW53_9AGAM|nr:hypothetical protein SCLCIDRAFT_103778 [Scleroderma citrinum Foug A]